MSAPAISPSSVVARSDDAIAAPLGDELAMMDIEAGKYYMLDGIAGDVWSQLASPTRVDQVLARLQERYDVTPEQCEADVIALLEQMRDKGLVRVGG